LLLRADILLHLRGTRLDHRAWCVSLAGTAPAWTDPQTGQQNVKIDRSGNTGWLSIPTNRVTVPHRAHSEPSISSCCCISSSIIFCRTMSHQLEIKEFVPVYFNN
jgi:hypothetical protein